MSPSLHPDVPADLICSIYEAASEPAHWTKVQARLASWTGGAAASLQARRLEEQRGTALISNGLEDSQHQAYVTHHYRHDPHLVHLAQLPVGRALISREVLPLEELQAHTLLQ